MKTLPVETPAANIEADAIVVGMHTDEAMGPTMSELDVAMGGVLSRLAAKEEFSRKTAELTRLLSPPGLRTDQLVVVGLGNRDALDAATMFRSAGAAAKRLAGKPRRRVAFCFDVPWSEEVAEAAVCGAAVGVQGQDLYRAERKLHPFAEMVWRGVPPGPLATGAVLGECLNTTRRLVNEAPSVMTPVRFAEEATRLARECGLEVEVWDQSRLKDERCGALLAVARGSSHPPRMVILRHNGGRAGHAPLALIGKGVTFDSGGLSLKPTDAMKTMKCDMAGAATVLGALMAAARLQLPQNVVGYAGLVENMVSGDAYKLGDVLTARNGTTIEVLNTDAEGRLVLADVLSVAVDQGAGRLIDVATLTGACVVALGTDVAGLMTNQQPWCDELIEAARVCGESVWQLPMFPEFGEQIQSDIADIKNSTEGRWGGTITAAKFLERFVGDRAWIHIDVAGPSFAEKPKAWLDAGATGALVRTLVQVIRRMP